MLNTKSSLGFGDSVFMPLVKYSIPKLVLRLVLNYFTFGGCVSERAYVQQWSTFTVRTLDVNFTKQGG